MNDNEFPKNELKNGMFGAVKTRFGKFNWFVLIKQNDNKFFMVYQNGSYDIIGNDIEKNFSIDDGRADGYGEIIYLISGEIIASFNCAMYCYEDKTQNYEFEWRREK